MKWTKAIGTTVVAGFLMAGCSMVSGITDQAPGLSDATDRAQQRARETAEEVRETEITLNAQDENILNNVDQVRERCPADSVPYSDEDDFDTKRRAVGHCETAYSRVDGQLESIDQAKRRHARYVEARQYVDQLGEVLPQWDEAIAEMADIRAEDRETFAAYRDFFYYAEMAVIERLRAIQAGEEPSSYYQFHFLEQRLEAAHNLDTRVEDCRERFDTDRNFTYFGEDEARHPANACYMAYNWRTYMAQYLSLHAINHANEERSRLEAYINRLGSHGNVSVRWENTVRNMEEHRDSIFATYNEYFEAMGEEMSEEARNAIASLVDIQEFHAATFATSQQEMRWDASGLHQNRDVRTSLNPLFSESEQRILQYGVNHADWNIQHAPTGAPVSRVHYGGVLTQRSGDNFCRAYAFISEGQFDGTGYTAPRAALRPDGANYILTACP